MNKEYIKELNEHCEAIIKDLEKQAFDHTIDKLVEHCDNMIHKIRIDQALIEKLKIERHHGIKELMSLKTRLMLTQLTLPLEHRHCYFCNLMTITNEDEIDCKTCNYGLTYGFCENGDSPYAKLMQLMTEARFAVLDYYERKA